MDIIVIVIAVPILGKIFYAILNTLIDFPMAIGHKRNLNWPSLSFSPHVISLSPVFFSNQSSPSLSLSLSLSLFLSLFFLSHSLSILSIFLYSFFFLPFYLLTWSFIYHNYLSNVVVGRMVIHSHSSNVLLGSKKVFRQEWLSWKPQIQ